jgi:REP element-mobilizing transposase RayT
MAGKFKERNMPSTYLSLHYHLIFSTKNREASLAPEWRGRLFAYLGGLVRGLGGIPEEVGGVADHVHLLVGLKATHCVADFVRDLKKRSSVWVHDQIHVPTFSWQEGYAGFTLSATSRGGVRNYIMKQEEHHNGAVSFRDELISLLKAAEIEYDPKYLD